MKKNLFTTKNLAGTAILSALSVVLYIFIKFPLPSLFPSFLDIQISEIPCLIAGFAFGPLFGAISVFIRFLIKLPFSTTAMVGELGDLVIGLSLVIPSSLIYKKVRSLKGALGSFAISAIISTLVAVAINAFILIPFYIKFFFNGDSSILLGMCSMIKGIDATNFMKYYLLYAVIPFNLLRYTIVGIFTFLLYKRIKFLLDKIK